MAWDGCRSELCSLMRAAFKALKKYKLPPPVYTFDGYNAVEYTTLVAEQIAVSNTPITFDTTNKDSTFPRSARTKLLWFRVLQAGVVDIDDQLEAFNSYGILYTAPMVGRTLVVQNDNSASGGLGFRLTQASLAAGDYLILCTGSDPEHKGQMTVRFRAETKQPLFLP